MNVIESWTRGVVGALALVALLAIFEGIWRGTHRPRGRSTGRYPGWLRSPLFYLVTSLGFFGICVLLWRPLPLMFIGPARWIALLLGGFLCIFGLVVVLWGRLALGQMYFVSSSFGAELYSGHYLVTQGPYRFIRHPMYAGMIAASFGGLLLYHTWAMVFLAGCSLAVILRARREEQALAAEFGVDWQAYCQRVPCWIPRWRRKGK